MAKQSIDTNAFIYPMPVALVGAMVEGKANFMAVGWVTRTNFQPPWLAVGINKKQHTAKGIIDSGEFSVCTPRASQVELTDYCGLVSGKRSDKSGLFRTFTGVLSNAPMIEDFPLCLECSLVRTVDQPTNWLFIGEIKGAWCDEDFLTDGMPDITKIDPLLLTMPDNNYFRVGGHVARAWHAGKMLKKGGQS